MAIRVRIHAHPASQAEIHQPCIPSTVELDVQ
jgi:hypothetical protein